MYSRIVNPMTGRKVSVNGRLGQSIIKKYIETLNNQYGGAVSRFDPAHLQQLCDFDHPVACTIVTTNWLGLHLLIPALADMIGPGGVRIDQITPLLEAFKVHLRNPTEKEKFEANTGMKITGDPADVVTTTPISFSNNALRRPLTPPEILHQLLLLFANLRSSDMIAGNNYIASLGAFLRYDGSGHCIVIGILPGSLPFILDIHGAARGLGGLYIGVNEVYNYIKQQQIETFFKFSNLIEMDSRSVSAEQRVRGSELTLTARGAAHLARPGTLDQLPIHRVGVTDDQLELVFPSCISGGASGASAECSRAASSEAVAGSSSEMEIDISEKSLRMDRHKFMEEHALRVEDGEISVENLLRIFNATKDQGLEMANQAVSELATRGYIPLEEIVKLERAADFTAQEKAENAAALQRTAADLTETAAAAAEEGDGVDVLLKNLLNKIPGMEVED